MLKKILIGLFIGIVALVIVINMQPSEFRVSRSLLITAPASKVFEQVNDFRNWQAWSPWAKLDPNAKAIFEGPSSGVGATFKWVGNDMVGEGVETITESKPDLIRIRLEFLKPFKATNMAEFTFKPQGDQTWVTWSMYGQNNFISKAMGLIMNCDKMIGEQFEKGLASLKSITEGSK